MKNFTKIVATVGPASSSYEMLLKLAKAGVNVFRLNFSHGSPEEHAERARNIRRVAKEIGRPIGILADMQGPKLRVGKFADGPVHLAQGDRFTLDLNPEPGNKSRVNLPHPEIIEVAEEGHQLLLDDGKMRLKVLKRNADSLETEVVVGGKLSERKGVNVPDVALPIPALTKKDRADLQTALSLNVDFIALSFVQKPEDVIEARELIGDKAWIVSKIEKPQALESIEEIIELSDAIMIARGDLAVEIGAAKVPAWQKRILHLSRERARPVIVATQMLESMIDAPVPTRAEVTDVANAVFDGADAVMLSAESAAGKYPVQAVETMSAVIADAQSNPEYFTYNEHIELDRPDDFWEHIGFDEEDFLNGEPKKETLQWVADEYHDGDEKVAREALKEFFLRKSFEFQLTQVLGAVKKLTNGLPVAFVSYADTEGKVALKAASERFGAGSVVYVPEVLAGRLALLWGVRPRVSDKAEALASDSEKLQAQVERDYADKSDDYRIGFVKDGSSPYAIPSRFWLF